MFSEASEPPWSWRAGEAGAYLQPGFWIYLMEKEVKFPYVVGVSAGSCNALDYVSRQPGRTMRLHGGGG